MSLYDEFRRNFLMPNTVAWASLLLDECQVENLETHFEELSLER